MNKKEMNEIKKNFTDASGLLSIERIQIAYVNTQKEICCKTNKHYGQISQPVAEVIVESITNVLKGTLGKNITEYKFPNEAYEQHGAQCTLYKALSGKLTDTDANEELINRIVNGMAYDLPYAIIMTYCTYSVMTKNKNDEFDGNADNIFSFIVTAVCPVEQPDFGLVYDSAKHELLKKDNTEHIISKKPTDGFMYPVFSDRAADVNSVACYTSKPNEANTTVVEEVLGCKYTLSATGAKKALQELLSDVVGDEMTVAVATQVNDAVRTCINEHKNDTELPTIDAEALKRVLASAGVSAEKLEAFRDAYAEKIGTPLIASNIVENKLTVSTDGVLVSVGDSVQQNVHTDTLNGRLSLVINLDDTNVQINGINAKLKCENVDENTEITATYAETTGIAED